MKKQLSPFAQIFIGVIAAIGWFALSAQFYINATLKITPIPEMIIRYFTYFTIQTNIIVAVCFTAILMNPNSKIGSFFCRQQVIAAVTVYILIVGLIYNTILRFLWAPTGLQQLVDELLHTVIPVMAIVYWLLFAAKNALKWKHILSWLIYPFAYIFYVLLRGSVSGFYPYPFINTAQLGLNKVVANSVGIAGVFIFFSLLLVAISKVLPQKKQM
ncbi:MAG: Pr6Pr family membrane protein [Chitinophagaceae bacterium]